MRSQAKYSGGLSPGSDIVSMAATQMRPEPIDLSACDRQEIHLLSAIEPSGGMLVLGHQTLTVLQTSSNILQFLGLPPEAVLGMHHLASFACRTNISCIVSGSGTKSSRRVTGPTSFKDLITLLLIKVSDHLECRPPSKKIQSPRIYIALQLQLWSDILWGTPQAIFILYLCQYEITL